jgi:serine/threonine-protein kinase PknK
MVVDTGEVQSKSRIVIADDSFLLREGVASLLTKAGYEVVGQASDPTTLLEVLREIRCDLAIIDIRMPPTHTSEGIDVARTIRRDHPRIGILLLSAHVELETAIDLLEDGESIGYVLKDTVLKVGDLIDALDRVSAGESVIDPALVKELFRQKARNDPLAALTSRELDVLALVAEGRSNSGIAHRIFVTEGAVEKHVRSILSKLDLPSGDEDHRRVLAVLTYLGAR